jgi:hypothetical protein
MNYLNMNHQETRHFTRTCVTPSGAQVTFVRVA